MHFIFNLRGTISSVQVENSCPTKKVYNKCIIPNCSCVLSNLTLVFFCLSCFVFGGGDQTPGLTHTLPLGDTPSPASIVFLWCLKITCHGCKRNAQTFQNKTICVFTKHTWFTKKGSLFLWKLLPKSFKVQPPVSSLSLHMIIQCKLQLIATHFFLIYQGLVERSKMKRKYKFKIFVLGLMAYYSANFLHAERHH
jgi:hypothetical protein